MRLFSRKPKIGVREFCQGFYDDYIVNPNVEGIDANLVYCDAILKSLAEVDPSFTDIDAQWLSNEMTVLRMELFGLSWLHHVGDKRAPEQSTFTKEYLDRKGMLDTWEAMEDYNKAIARSSTLGQTADTATGRAYLAFIDSMRMQMFSKWHGQGFDPQCVARAVNRLGSEEAWKKSLTPGYIMLTLCDRLGYELNEEAQFRLTAAIVGLYNGAREALNEVK